MRVIQTVQSPDNEPVEIVWLRDGSPLAVVNSIASIMSATEEEPDRWTPSLLSIRVEVSEPLPYEAHQVHYVSENPDETWSVYREWYAHVDSPEPLDAWTRKVSTHSTMEQADAEATRLQSMVTRPVKAVTHVTNEPERSRCTGCGNRHPIVDRFCQTCEEALDEAQYADLQEETDWALVLPSRLAGEFAVGARRTLRHQHARLLIQRSRS